MCARGCFQTPSHSYYKERMDYPAAPCWDKEWMRMGKIPSMWNYLNNRLANLISTGLIRPHQLPQLSRRRGGWQAGCALRWRMTASVAMCFAVPFKLPFLTFWWSKVCRDYRRLWDKRGSHGWLDPPLMWPNTSAEERSASDAWPKPSSWLLATSCALWVLLNNNLVGSAELANILKWLIDCIVITFTLIIWNRNVNS